MKLIYVENYLCHMFYFMILFLCFIYIMAKKEDILGIMDSLDSGGPINLRGDGIKRSVLKKKLLSTYGMSESDYEKDPEMIDGMITDILENGRGEFSNRLDSDLSTISSTFNQVISQAPELLAQLSSIPLALISTTAAGPTVPNPVAIKNDMAKVKATAASMSSNLNIALGKVIEYGLEDYIPEIVITSANILVTIQNFPI